jgi:hypothetical protein
VADATTWSRGPAAGRQQQRACCPCPGPAKEGRHLHVTIDAQQDCALCTAASDPHCTQPDSSGGCSHGAYRGITVPLLPVLMPGSSGYAYVLMQDPTLLPQQPTCGAAGHPGCPRGPSCPLSQRHDKPPGTAPTSSTHWHSSGSTACDLHLPLWRYVHLQAPCYNYMDTSAQVPAGARAQQRQPLVTLHTSCHQNHPQHSSHLHQAQARAQPEPCCCPGCPSMGRQPHHTVT